MKTSTNRSPLWPCGLMLLCTTLAGCGGGGSATPAAQVQPAAVTLSGTIQDAGANPLSGYTVVYTPAGATAHVRKAQAAFTGLSTVTDSQGCYALSVPVSQITTNATLAVFDTSGNQVQTQTLTLSTTQSAQTVKVTVVPSTTTTSTPIGAPPAPPAPPV